MDNQVKYLLQESEMPRQWYNVIPDLPSPPPPPLHPGTRQPVGPDDLAPLFPMALIAQEVSADRHIAIPEPVLDVYRLWRPTPLYRARRLEKDLGTPARIYYKYEGVSPAGSHKPNTAVPQAYYNAAEGVSQADHRDRRRPVGQRAGLRVGAVRPRPRGLDGPGLLRPEAVPQDADGDLRRDGAPEPVRRHLRRPGDAAEHPDSTGSLGIAISEAVEVAGADPTARYALGSVLNHVLMHQTIIGEEAIKQLAMAGDTPGRDRRLHRRRLQLRRPGLPVPAREAGGPDEPGDPRRRAGRLPVVHPRRLRLRLRRHGRVHAAAQDAHPRARLHPGPDPRGRAALPRHVAAAVAHLRARA